jgi:threonine dehydrogenase-like Zn-dependent dehydrogenase
MSRHEPRQQLALEFGATDIVEARGDEGVARMKELTGGLGAHSVIEAVGTQESMMQAIRSTRPGGHIGYVGVPHDVELPARSCSSHASICTAVPHPFAASCRSWSTSSGTARLTRARSSTSPCHSIR